MRIAGFIKTSLIDWDGHVSSVIFLPGCNFRCPFCHNMELVLRPDEVPAVPLEEIMNYLEQNADFLDGVVVTGGEPTLHADLAVLLSEIKKIGLKVKLDTNGSRPQVLLDLIGAGLIDSISMDLKGPLDARYEDLVGCEPPLDEIKRSIALIMDAGIDYEFRTTVVPVLLRRKDIEDIAAFVGGARKYVLQQFQPKNTLDERMSLLDPYPEEELRQMAEAARGYVRRLIIRGV